MRLIESFGKVPDQKIRGWAVGTRLSLLIIFVLLATAPSISQDRVENFELLWSFGFGPVASVDYSPDGSRIAVSGSSTVFILDCTSYAIERQLFGHTGLIWSVKWSPDGRYE